MKAEVYPFVARPLPYEYDALVPVLDAETLTFHHDKHYKTYVDNLNSALSDYPTVDSGLSGAAEEKPDGAADRYQHASGGRTDSGAQ